ncbi:b(0,+)-type amino acid transporter 1 [Thelohanellus kitauei]|uniref:B(0,+)-type amino acid transporter 1 n=1 Tax=Thelohanellus kitauei TaxID=669202 RepID=A0A0C2MJ61_THEKT|nr:b(0,+)-type amino acid transporter 1 [Thelohanellus kitauei]
MDERSSDVEIMSAASTKMSLVSATLMLAGTIIGTGIFMTPNEVVKVFPSIFYSLLIWVICGIISFFAALCYAEMGSKFPSLGGEYTYFKAVFHEMISFAYLFTNFLLIKPVCIAMLIIFFSTTILSIFFKEADQMEWTIRLISFYTILMICLLNCLSEKWTIRVNNILTYLKFIAMGIVVGIAIYKLAIGENQHIKDLGFGITVSAENVSKALYNGMWAYDGFNSLGFMVDKIDKPKKNLILASVLGMTAVVFSYLLVNFGYLVILGVEQLSNANEVALLCVETYFKKCSFIMAILVGLSAFSTANSTSYSGGNLYFDASQCGHFPSILAAYHIKFKTYVPALFIQTVIVMIYILITTKMETLLIYFSGASWVYYSLTFLGVIIARYSDKVKRTQKTSNTFELWIGIPVFTFIVGVGIVILGFIDDTQSAIISVSIIICSIPL